MTEQEYIDVGDRMAISLALNALREVIPESSSVVTDEEYLTVMRLIRGWERKLFKVVKIMDTEG